MTLQEAIDQIKKMKKVLEVTKNQLDSPILKDDIQKDIDALDIALGMMGVIDSDMKGTFC